MLGRQLLDLRERVIDITVDGNNAAERVGAVLGLRGELEPGDLIVGVRTREHDDLGRAGREVDRDMTRDKPLRLVHVGVARPDDLVHLRKGLRAERKRGDRGRPAEGPHLLEPEQPRRGGDEARTARRRGDDDPLDAGDLRRHGAHD